MQLKEVFFGLDLDHLFNYLYFFLDRDCLNRNLINCIKKVVDYLLESETHSNN